MHYLLTLFLIVNLLTPVLDALSPDQIPIFPCTINRTDKRKCTLSICAIFKDEADFLKEWIEYHRLVGVSHFYLYNNLSNDRYWEILKPYVDKGIVELFDVPFDSTCSEAAASHNFVQVVCYNHAIKLASKKSTWLAIIDSDEFICPVIDYSIPDALDRYGKVGGVVVYWQIYGTSNVWELQPDELMIEKLVYKEPNSGNGLFKSIVRPEKAKCLDPHWTTTSGLPLVLPNRQPFSHTPGFSLLPIDILRINHYTYRTESFYYTVKKQRRAQWGDRPSPEEERRRLDFANSEYDPIMHKFVPLLKKRMKQKGV